MEEGIRYCREFGSAENSVLRGIGYYRKLGTVGNSRRGKFGTNGSSTRKIRHHRKFKA